MYFLAIFIPPVAVLMCNKPGQAILSFILWLFFWIPGSIHACMVVSEFKANERQERLIRAMRSRDRHDTGYHRDDESSAIAEFQANQQSNRRKPQADSGYNPFDHIH